MFEFLQQSPRPQMGSVRLRVGQEVELCLDDAGLQAGDPTYMCNSCHRHGTDGKSTPSPGCASGTLCSWQCQSSLLEPVTSVPAAPTPPFPCISQHSGLSYSPVRNSFVPTRQEKLAVRMRWIFLLSSPLPLPLPRSVFLFPFSRSLHPSSPCISWGNFRPTQPGELI